MRTTTLAIMEPGSDWRHWSSERMPMSWPLGSFRYARVLAPASTLRPRIVPKAPAERVIRRERKPDRIADRDVPLCCRS
jgi:hypothetical protein